MAMTARHRQILQENHMLILTNIGDVVIVAEGLYDKGIITENMKEEILVPKIKREKIAKLMEIIPTRGDKAFDIFLEVLKDNKENVVADAINPVPPVFLKPAADIIVQQCATEEMKSKFKHSLYNSIYPMNRNPRGICVVISNEIFQRNTKFIDLPGNKIDADSLDILFNKLQFSIKRYTNQKATEMKKIIEDYRKENHRDFDCFVFIVLSHGGNGAVYGTDGKTVKIEEDILAGFDAESCESLCGTPKLFFIQACSGKKFDPGVAVPASMYTPTGAGIAVKIPTYADMFIATASTPGYVSWTCNNTGSYFIRAIVYIFKDHSNETDLLRLMTSVNAMVQSDEITDEEGKTYKQTSEFRTTFGKQLYFFPGLIKN